MTKVRVGKSEHEVAPGLHVAPIVSRGEGFGRRNRQPFGAAGNQVGADTGEAPVVLVDRVGREAGLASAFRGTQPNGTGVRVQLEAAPFDILVTWLATLDERYGLAIESITVDRAARPGVVNASITLTQPHR